MSGIGKGISVASLARILKSEGFRATCVKIDPYLNGEAGTMNPIEHGEVFVTEDGMETDQHPIGAERVGDGARGSGRLAVGRVVSVNRRVLVETRRRPVKVRRVLGAFRARASDAEVADRHC